MSDAGLIVEGKKIILLKMLETCRLKATERYLGHRRGVSHHDQKRFRPAILDHSLRSEGGAIQAVQDDVNAQRKRWLRKMRCEGGETA